MDKLTSEERYYIIGFLQGDGSLSETTRNRGKLTLEISIRDIDIIHKIRNIFIREYPNLTISISIRTRNTNFKDNYTSVCLCVYNKTIRQQIEKFVPIGKKADRITPPTILDSKNIRHYIRGLTDADGSLGITSNNRPFWSLCTSSEKIKDFILKEINKQLEITKRINRNNRDTTYNISLFDEDAVIWSKYLYDNTVLALSRKLVKAKNEICYWQRTIPKRKGQQKSWIIEEDKLLLSNTLSIKELQRLLNRSKSSIQTRLWRLTSNK